MAVIDVRYIKSFTDTWEVGCEGEHEILFLIADDYYLRYHASIVKDYYQYASECAIKISLKEREEDFHIKKLSYTVTLKYGTPQSWAPRYGIEEDEEDEDDSETKLDSKRYQCLHEYRNHCLQTITLNFEVEEDKTPTFVVNQEWYETLMAHMKEEITLIGSDGEVKAKMELLKLKSSVMRTMLEMESSIEYKTKTVEIPDFSIASLKDFVTFLASDVIGNAPETALDLLLLADKYDVPSLKAHAEKYLFENMDRKNVRNVYRVFSKVSPELAEELCVKAMTLLTNE